MRVFTLLYSIYGLLVFSSVFIFFSIPLLLGIWFKSLKRMAYWAHHKIARMFFALIFIPIKISYDMTESQKDIIRRSLELYGSTDLGVSRILTKVFVKKILRTGSIPDKSQKSGIQIKNAADWPYC